MKSKSLLIVLLAAAMVPASLGLAAKKPEAPAKETRTEKGVAEPSFEDVLDTPAVRKAHPEKGLLVAVARAGNRVVAVGQHGTVAYSDNQGKTWTQASVPVSCDLLGVFFATPQKGWAVGHDGVILHSTDGGAKWVKQFDGRTAARVMASHYMANESCATCHREAAPPTEEPAEGNTADAMADMKQIVEQGPDKPFLDVWFENETTGFVVGAFNLIFQTTDGGKSWTPWYDRIDNPKHYHLYSIRPVGGEIFITAEQGTVFKLDPAQGRFKQIKTPYTGTFFGVTGKPGAVVAYGMRGNVFVSRDGGQQWQKVETGVPAGLTGAALTADGKIVLVSQGGHILVSSDNAASFARVKVDQPTPAAAVAALDGNTLALAGQRGVKVQAIR